MEQPVAKDPAVTVILQFNPETGEMRIGWPKANDVLILGMLQTAICSLTELKVKSAQSPKPSILQ